MAGRSAREVPGGFSQNIMSCGHDEVNHYAYHERTFNTKEKYVCGLLIDYNFWCRVSGFEHVRKMCEDYEYVGRGGAVAGLPVGGSRVAGSIPDCAGRVRCGQLIQLLLRAAMLRWDRDEE
ncbi:hypothetical protein ACJJTC_006243 [Scirpophaga incertulas]